MNLCDELTIRMLLERHGFHFSKAKGQNFLIAPWVPQSIAEQAGVDETAGSRRLPARTQAAACWRSARASAL